MTTKHEIQNTIGGLAPEEVAQARAIGGNVDRKQSVAPDPMGPIMSYEERRAAIRASFKESEEGQDFPRTEEETERLVDAEMDREHLPGPIPEGKLYRVQCHDAEGKEIGTPSAAMTHEDALEECKMRNDNVDDDTWWGVTHAPVEAK